MTHNIKLNTAIDLNFKIVRVDLPEAVSRVVYSAEQVRFIDIETTRNQGFVDITSDSDEWIAEIDGHKAYGQVTFDAVEYTYPEGTRSILWEIYSFSDKGIEDDVEFENVATSEIPTPIVDMLL